MIRALIYFNTAASLLCIVFLGFIALAKPPSFFGANLSISTVSTSTFPNGITLSTGCFYSLGACLGSGGSFSFLNSTTTTIAQGIATSTFTTSANNLHVVINTGGYSSASSNMYLQMNSDAGGNYGSSCAVDGTAASKSSAGGRGFILDINATSSPMTIIMDITNISGTSHYASWTTVANNSGSNAPIIQTCGGVWSGTAALTSVSLRPATVGTETYSAGTSIYVYAVKSQ